MRAVCYPRVSSAQQRERDSIATQLRELPAIATRNGWQLVRPVDHYIDDGRSAKAGKLSKRTGLKHLLADAAAGEFDVVIMAAVDRLTRSERWAERGMIIGALQDAGVRVCSSDGELIDLDTDEGDLIISLKSYVAAAENRRKSKAIRGGKLTSAIKGGKPTGPDPYGLHYDKASNTWSLDPARAPIVREIFERLAAGESCIAIACDLAVRKVPCNGRVWNKAIVRYMARSTTPIGEYVAHRKSRTTIAVPPMVDVELWQRAQDAMTKNRKNGLRRTKYVYLLERLGVCGLCGARMRMRTAYLKRGKHYVQAAYVCERKLPHLPVALRDPNEPRCSVMMLVADADAAAWAEICRQLEDPKLPGELAAERQTMASDARTWESDAAGYRDHLARLDKVETAILERFRRGDISEGALDSELAKLRRERLAVRSQLGTAEKARGAKINAQARLGEATEMIRRLRTQAAAATQEERREIALALIDPGSVHFFKNEIRIELGIERPASTHSSGGAMVVDGVWSGDRETTLRIQAVAKLAG